MSPAANWPKDKFIGKEIKMPTLKDQVLGELQAMYGKPVMDKDGKVIGRIGKDPEEPTISAEERIYQGFIQAAEAKMKDISAVLEKMSDAVWNWKKAKDNINWLSFASRQKAHAIMEPLEKQIFESRSQVFNEMRRHLGYPECESFKKLVTAHVGELNSIMGVQFTPAADAGERITQGLEGEGGGK